MKQLWEFGYALRKLQARMKYGELSRAPLRFSRLEWKFEEATCHWIARQADPWDANFPADMRERHASLQALEDALVLRELLFAALPGVELAMMRGYRFSEDRRCELILIGKLARATHPNSKAASIAMRAKLAGFQFSMEDGILGELQMEAEPWQLQLTNDPSGSRRQY